MPTVHSIGVSIPGFFATNSYVKELVLLNSQKHWQGSQSLEYLIDDFFQASGSHERVWRSANSLPKDHLTEAIEQCLLSAPEGILERISSVVFCGIDRGFVEPAHASAIASQAGLDHVRAFDIADACLGWFTACQAAKAFATKNEPYALILSAEFPLDDPGLVFPDAFTIRNLKEFEWKCAAFTLGEMATATLIDASARPTKAVVQSENQHHQLCIVPIKKPWRFVDWRQDIPLTEHECFLSNGSRLSIVGFRSGLQVLESYIEKFGEPDVIVPHAFSTRVPHVVAKRLSMENRLHNVFERIGNISTSSIPFGLWSLSKERSLTDQKVIGWVASAGMKHAAFEVKWAT